MNQSHIYALIAAASNLKVEENTGYTKEDFLKFYPQFKDQISDEILDSFVKLGVSNVNKARFGASWNIAINNYIAHFLSMYLDTSQRTKTGTPGVVSSKSVDGVSVSYDTSSILKDLDGWGAFKLTGFGITYANLAKVYSRMPFYVI